VFIYLSNVQISEESKLKLKNLFYFSLTVLGTKHYLAADDGQERSQWIRILTDASKITVDAEAYDDEQCDSIGSYTTEIVGGVVHRIALETSEVDSDSSCDEHERIRSRDMTLPHTVKPPIKSGYGVKQGAMRKNWKKRFFVLNDDGFSYYKSKEECSPIRVILRGEIIEARVSIGIHKNRESVFEVVTPHRVFYVQSASDEERNSWISAINDLKMSKLLAKKSVSVMPATSKDYPVHSQLSEMQKQVPGGSIQARWSSTL